MKTALRIFFATLSLCIFTPLLLQAQTNTLPEPGNSPTASPSHPLSSPAQMQTLPAKSEGNADLFSKGRDRSAHLFQSVIFPGMTILFGLAIIGSIFDYYFRYRRNQQLHETLRFMVEKGVAIPRDLLVKDRLSANLRNGLILIGLGVALIVGCYFEYGFRFNILAFVPFFIGLAFLTTWLVEKNDRNKNQTLK